MWPPPNQDVAVVQCRFAKALVGIVQTSRLDVQARLLAKITGNLVSKKVGVSLFLRGLLFIPNQDADGSRKGRKDRQDGSKYGQS